MIKCSEKAPLIVDVAKNISWSGLTSDLSLQMLSRAMGCHDKGENWCNVMLASEDRMTPQTELPTSACSSGQTCITRHGLVLFFVERIQRPCYGGS